MYIAAPEDTADTRRFYEANVKSQGFQMNMTKAWAWRTDVYDAFAALRTELMKTSALTKRDFAVLVSATAAALGDSYCALAWGTTLSKEAGAATAAAVLKDTDEAALTQRDRALAAWARKVTREPNATAPADVEELRQAGLGEREIMEATAFVAFRMAFSTFNDALGIRPDWQLVEAAPTEVAEAVTFGRPPASRG